MDISVVIPAFNPDLKLAAYADSLIENKIDDIIIINDGSAAICRGVIDELKKRPEITVLSNRRRKGRGACLKMAFEFIKENRPESRGALCAVSDGRFPYEALSDCIKASREDPESIIIGARNFGKRPVSSGTKAGRKFTSLIYRFALGVRLEDTQSSLRFIPAKYLDFFCSLPGEGCTYESRMLIGMINKKIPYKEIRVSVTGRLDNILKNFNSFGESLKIYAVVLKYFIKFSLSSFSSYLIDIAVYALLLYFIAGSLPAASQVLVCTVISRIVSTFFNYLLNKKAVFESTAGNVKTSAKFWTVAVLKLAASYVLVYLLTDILAVGSGLQLVIKAAVDLFLFVFNYYIQRSWVFKHKKA